MQASAATQSEDSATAEKEEEEEKPDTADLEEGVMRGLIHHKGLPQKAPLQRSESCQATLAISRQSRRRPVKWHRVPHADSVSSLFTETWEDTRLQLGQGGIRGRRLPGGTLLPPHSS